MLGSALVELYKNYFTIFTTGSSKSDIFENYMQFDLESESYKDLINWSNPDVIIHCAAITNGNECKNNPLRAYAINGMSVQKLINATNDNVKIIYISTDAVFPNALHLARESDIVSPESIYGKSKELGEFFLLHSNRIYTILRTTIVGLNTLALKSSFVEWIINSVKQEKEITLFDDVIFTPISIWDLAIEIKEILTSNDKYGIYHVAGSEICSKYHFGITLVNELGLDNKFIKRGSIAEFSDRANRSGDQTLSVQKYINDFNRTLPRVNETINNIKCHYETN